MSELQYTIANNPFWFEFLKAHLRKRGIIVKIKTKKNQIINIPFIKIGRKWVCLPYNSAIGIIDYSITTVLNCGIPHHKLCRVKWEIRCFENFSLYNYSSKVISYLELYENPKKQFMALGSNLRRKIRKAERNSIFIQKTNSISLINSQHIIFDFYKVYSYKMRELGSPVCGLRFFKKLINEYQNGVAVCCVAYFKNIPIGGAISLSYNEQFENYWFATLKDYNFLYTSYALHWNMIQDAIQSKMKIYSFGRSTKNSGVHKYKNQWGCEDQQIYWNYSHPRNKNLREMKYLSDIWKKLPLWACNLIGPMLAKRIY